MSWFIRHVLGQRPGSTDYECPMTFGRWLAGVLDKGWRRGTWQAWPPTRATGKGGVTGHAREAFTGRCYRCHAKVRQP